MSQSLLGGSLFPILSTSSFQSFPLLSARRFAPTRTIGGHRKNILLLAVSAAAAAQKVATDVWVVTRATRASAAKLSRRIGAAAAAAAVAAVLVHKIIMGGRERKMVRERRNWFRKADLLSTAKLQEQDQCVIAEK